MYGWQKFMLALAAAPLVLTGTAQSRKDEPVAAATRTSAFRDLAEAKTPDAIWERSFRAMLDRAKIAFLQDPKFAKADAECPGFLDAIFTASGTLMRARHFADRDRLRDGMAQIFAEGLTEPQAREAAAFYTSTEGQFLLELGADSNSYDERFAAAMTQDASAFDRAAFARDLARTQDAIDRNVDPKLVERVMDQLSASRWYPAYLKLHSRIHDLRFAISQAPPDAGHAALIDQAVKRGAIQHFANCGKKVPLRTP